MTEDEGKWRKLPSFMETVLKRKKAAGLVDRSLSKVGTEYSLHQPHTNPKETLKGKTEPAQVRRKRSRSGLPRMKSGAVISVAASPTR